MQSLAGAYLIGLAFAFGWTPCIGPILATVLAVAANEASLAAGVSLLFVYSLGLGIPFVLAAVAMRPFLGFSQRFKRHLGTVEKVMGVVLIVTGLLFMLGWMNTIGQWMLDDVPRAGADRGSAYSEVAAGRHPEERTRPVGALVRPVPHPQ